MSLFEGFPMPFAGCAPTVAATDMATTAVVSIQFDLMWFFSSFEQAERACVRA